MLASNSSSVRQIGGTRAQATRLRVGAAALAVLLGGAITPSAQAIEPGNWILESSVELADGLASGVGVDPSSGDVYVTNMSTAMLFKYNSSGEKLTSRGGPGTGYGKFDTPKGVAVDADGYVYVADAGNDLIQKFDKDLNFVAQWGGTGSSDGEFKYPRDVAIDPDGNVLVADLQNDRIQKFTSDGTWASKFGTAGQGLGELSHPKSLTVTKGGIILVSDSGNNRVSAYFPDGTPQGSFGSTGAELGQFHSPDDIEVDEKGYIFVNDYGNSRIQRFDGGGNPLTEWTTLGSAMGMDLDRKTRRVYVLMTSKLLAYREASSPKFTTGLKPSAIVGKPYTSVFAASGFPAPAFSVIDGSLPKGFTLNGDTVSGVKRKAGAYSVSLRADNGDGDPATEVFTVTVGKASSVLKTSWSTKYPKVKKTKIVAKLRISAPGTTGLSRTGTMKIYYGGKYIKSVKVYPSYKGVVTVKLPVFHKKGKKKIVVKYQGNSQLTSSTYVKYVTAK